MDGEEDVRIQVGLYKGPDDASSPNTSIVQKRHTQ